MVFQVQKREEEEARRQYQEVYNRFHDKNGKPLPGWMKAPSGKDTNLTERQWVQVRTDNFRKNYFGEWEKLYYQEMASNDWPAGFGEVFSIFETEDSGGWKLLGGIDGYQNAKHQQDEKSAEQVVRGVFELHPEAKDKIKALAKKHPNAIVVPVFRPEGMNRLPGAYARAIGDITRLEVDRGIVQTNRTGRTGADDFSRLANRNVYDGQVIAGREYILVDDVYSRGGSLSELRHYIEQRGGKVVLLSTLADGGKGRQAALTEATRKALVDKHGENAVIQFCKELELYGGNYNRKRRVQ